MTDRDRLIELLNKVKGTYFFAGDNNLNSLADYLLANGVIVPPCKVGDTVYSIKRTYSECHLGCYYDEFDCEGCEEKCDSRATYDIQEEKVNALEFYGEYWRVKTNGVFRKSIGISNLYSVFLTKEEAEEKLKELGK